MSVNIKAGGGENVTPEVQAQTPLVTEILESLVGKVTLANATPETILEGYSAYVGQELVEGTRKSLETIFGLTKINSGTLINTSNTAINIKHNLNVIPKIFMIYIINQNGVTPESNTLINMIYAPGLSYVYNNQVGTASFQSSKWSIPWILLRDRIGVSDDAVKPTETSHVMQANVEYAWIAMA